MVVFLKNVQLLNGNNWGIVTAEKIILNFFQDCLGMQTGKN
jgi:hypothetical protein